MVAVAHETQSHSATVPPRPVVLTLISHGLHTIHSSEIASEERNIPITSSTHYFPFLKREEGLTRVFSSSNIQFQHLRSQVLLLRSLTPLFCLKAIWNKHLAQLFVGLAYLKTDYHPSFPASTPKYDHRTL